MLPKPKAIIVDIDGTLADSRWRDHILHHPNKNWDDLNNMSKYDLPHKWCQELVRGFRDMGYEIIFCTARNENSEPVTREWLDANVLGPYQLIMRPKDDTRPDWMVKETLYHTKIEPFYEVLLCVEDRTSVATMWRGLGLTCLHCTDDVP